MANLDQLTICEFNVENLFISMEYYDGLDLTSITEDQWRNYALPQLRTKQKPLKKVWGISDAILEINPDILMLVEVGGRDSLENLNLYFLNNRYTPYFIEGNSERGIDLGYLVKREFPFKVEARTNKETPVEVYSFHGRSSARFSRDVAELRLYDGDRLNLILLLVHLKSKISTVQDMQGKDLRMAEANALTNLYQKLRSDFPGTPIVVGGDFNTDLTSLELELLSRTNLIDFREEIETRLEDRSTLTYFDFSGKGHPVILDYLLISPELRGRIDKSKSYVFRYRSFHSLENPLPQSYEERFQMPSDHYPIVVTLKI